MPAVPAQLLEILKNHDRILVAGHAHPDGDALGASAALGWALRALDKEVLVYNATGIPAYLNWLRVPEPVITRVADLPGKPNLIVALDSGDAARLGEDIQPLLAVTPSVNIDHHLGNPSYGSLFNWVDPTSAATGEMVGLLAEALGVPLDGPLGEGVYVALMSDTGAFAFGNTTPEALRLTARLMESGLNVPAVRACLDNNWTEAKMRLWGRLIQGAQVLEDGKLAVGMLGRAMLGEYKADKDDAEGFVEFMRRLRGVRVALFLRETAEGDTWMTKVSLRSAGRDDVRAVAVQFGGGGHKNAAGASLLLSMEKTMAAMLPYIRHVWANDPIPA